MIKLTSSKYFDFELVYIEEIDFVFLSIFLGLLIEQFGLYRVLGYLDVIMNRFSIIDSLSTVHRGDFFFHLKTYESKSNQTKKIKITKYIKCFPFHSFFLEGHKKCRTMRFWKCLPYNRIHGSGSGIYTEDWQIFTIVLISLSLGFIVFPQNKTHCKYNHLIL